MKEPMKAKCAKCKDIVEVSKPKEYKSCKCGAIALDFGDEHYSRMCGNPKDFDKKFDKENNIDRFKSFNDVVDEYNKVADGEGEAEFISAKLECNKEGKKLLKKVKKLKKQEEKNDKFYDKLAKKYGNEHFEEIVEEDEHGIYKGLYQLFLVNRRNSKHAYIWGCIAMGISMAFIIGYVFRNDPALVGIAAIWITLGLHCSLRSLVDQRRASDFYHQAVVMSSIARTAKEVTALKKKGIRRGKSSR